MALRAPFLNCSATAIICYTILQLHIPIEQQPTIISNSAFPAPAQLTTTSIPISKSLEPICSTSAAQFLHSHTILSITTS
ncbi:hypothetical protein C5167_005927 [Papaver somniferum]|uniref:Uncharacterized protein n=1 Tax=Papaver somniferum TaxID=3469 RepID=A0A4Y7JFC2_PAPSO|nr:hypothetical protein C5167_005927 [Papaver somniferum]